MENDSLKKKIRNTQLGLKGITPVSYIDKLFNSLTKNDIFIQDGGNINNIIPTPETPELELTTEDLMVLLVCSMKNSPHLFWAIP